MKKQAFLVQNIQETLALLSVDPFQPRLRTHKLKGELKDSYAGSVGYDLRIVFKFVEYEQKQAILLESIVPPYLTCGYFAQLAFISGLLQSRLSSSIVTAKSL